MVKKALRNSFAWQLSIEYLDSNAWYLHATGGQKTESNCCLLPHECGNPLFAIILTSYFLLWSWVGWKTRISPHEKHWGFGICHSDKNEGFQNISPQGKECLWVTPEQHWMHLSSSDSSLLFSVSVADFSKKEGKTSKTSFWIQLFLWIKLKKEAQHFLLYLWKAIIYAFLR